LFLNNFKNGLFCMKNKMAKRIIIIGGNSGIGESLLTMLVEAGHEVIAMSRNPKDVQAGSGVSHSIDISVESPDFPDISGAIDGLVYCPGSINLKPFGSLKIKDFQKDFDINFMGFVKTLQVYLPNLKMSERASIVAFSTVAVQTGMAFHTSVAAAKGAIEGFGRSLAAELAPEIRVNVIAPSLTDTPMAARLLRNEKQREASVNRHPLKQIGAAEDVASMAAYLLSDQAKWISGQIFHVDGGLSVIRGL